VRPLAHLFGHIHEGAGQVSSDGRTAFANASTCTFHYQATNPAIVLDLAFPGAPAEPRPAPRGGGGGSGGGGGEAAASNAAAAPPLCPSSVEFVQSRLAQWGIAEVDAWLDKQDIDAADTAAAAETAAGASPPSAPGSAVDRPAAPQLVRPHADGRVALLPPGASAALRGLPGPGLQALMPEDHRLDDLSRAHKAAAIQVLRQLEAEETN